MTTSRLYVIGSSFPSRKLPVPSHLQRAVEYPQFPLSRLCRTLSRSPCTNRVAQGQVGNSELGLPAAVQHLLRNFATPWVLQCLACSLAPDLVSSPAAFGHRRFPSPWSSCRHPALPEQKSLLTHGMPVAIPDCYTLRIIFSETRWPFSRMPSNSRAVPLNIRME